MEMRAEQPIKQSISRSLVLGRRRSHTTVVDSQMALHTKLGCRGSDLALAVGLDDATRDQHVSLGCIRRNCLDESQPVVFISALFMRTRYSAVGGMIGLFRFAPGLAIQVVAPLFG